MLPRMSAERVDALGAAEECIDEHGRPIDFSDDFEPRRPDEIGVGPWVGEWPTDPRYDPELLQHGDRRNVVDEFRYWTMEAIVADLDETRHPFHVAIENWQHDMNIGTIVRSANAFAADTVHIVGRRRWNKRGAMVTDRYQHVEHHETVAEFVERMHELELAVIAVDNAPGAAPIETTPLPERCVLVFGQEGPGLSAEMLEAADAAIEITQFGSATGGDLRPGRWLRSRAAASRSHARRGPRYGLRPPRATGRGRARSAGEGAGEAGGDGEAAVVAEAGVPLALRRREADVDDEPRHRLGRVEVEPGRLWQASCARSRSASTPGHAPPSPAASANCSPTGTTA